MSFSGKQIDDNYVMFGPPLNEKAFEALKRNSPDGNAIIKSLPKSAFIPVSTVSSDKEILKMQEEQKLLEQKEQIKKDQQKVYNRLARKKALAGGDKTFYWKGKRYGTKLKSEVKAKAPKKKVDVTPKSSTGKDTGPVIVPKKKDTKVYSSKTTFANKSRKYAGQTGKSSDKPATSKTKSTRRFVSPGKPSSGKPGIYKKPKATTRKKPYETKAGPAQPVAKPRAATKPKAASKPKAKPAAKKKSSGSAIGRFERRLVRGMNRGIRKAKRAVRRALK